MYAGKLRIVENGFQRTDGWYSGGVEHGPIDAGFAFGKCQAGNARARPDGGGQRCKLLAWYPPEVRRTARETFRRGQQRRLIFSHHDDVVIQLKDAAFIGLQLIEALLQHRAIAGRSRAAADVDARTVAAVVSRSDYDGQGEPGGGKPNARRHIGRRGILHG